MRAPERCVCPPNNPDFCDCIDQDATASVDQSLEDLLVAADQGMMTAVGPAVGPAVANDPGLRTAVESALVEYRAMVSMLDQNAHAVAAAARRITDELALAMAAGLDAEMGYYLTEAILSQTMAAISRLADAANLDPAVRAVVDTLLGHAAAFLDVRLCAEAADKCVDAAIMIP